MKLVHALIAATATTATLAAAAAFQLATFHAGAVDGINCIGCWG
ncbi:MAG: hypothetical protein ACJ73E_02155 [Mycobacteriales bacterium]